MSYKAVPTLEFSEKYDNAQAEKYFQKHQDGLMRNMSNRREIRMAEKALHMAGIRTA
ncbi:MAG: hypothetical protein IME93_04315 [Proteobacteria bacterium]|nr:hypothetical protein [Pseudomonadota bacterium]